MMIEHLKDYIGSEHHLDNILKAREQAMLTIQDKKQKRIDQYNLNPSTCFHCRTPLSYEKRKNRFCSSSCSASSNNTNRTVSEEQKQKVRDATSIRLFGVLGKTKTDNRVCANCNTVFTVKHRTQKCCSRDCLKEYNNKHRASEEYKAKMSNTMKISYKEGRSKGWASRDKMKPSYPEQYFMNMFNRDGIQYEREIKIGRYFADFVFDGNIVLEVDGSQHDREPYKSSDIQKDKFLVDQGFQVVRIRWRNVKTVEGYKAIQEQYERFKDIIPSVG